jgi:DNA-binding FadR family transcriptional regulator
MTGRAGLEVDPIRPAYLQVANQLRHKITTGELRVGDRLPVETDLAEMFGVSRSTVREALRHLASRQLITTQRGAGGGSRVVQPSTEGVEEYLASTIGLMTTTGEIARSALLEARVLLEPAAAGLAAIRRTEQQLDDIASARFDPVEDPYDIVVRRTRRFHLEILEAAGNPMLALMARPVYEVLGHQYIEKASSPAFWSKVAVEHEAVLDAIGAGDAEAAEAAMRSHLGDLRDLYRGLEAGPVSDPPVGSGLPLPGRVGAAPPEPPGRAAPG